MAAKRASTPAKAGKGKTPAKVEPKSQPAAKPVTKPAAKSTSKPVAKPVAKAKPAAKADAKATPKPAAKPVATAKRAASAVITPKPATPKPAPAPQPAADLPAGPTPEQIAAWRALSQEERRALREREAARIFSEAATAHQKGDLAAAIDGYNRSLFLNPRVPDVYNNLGVALRAQGKLEAAVVCYRRSLVLRPASAAVHSNMGNALRELGRLQSAVAAHQQAIKLAPNNPEAYYNLGLALRDLGQIDQALACFGRTLALKPDHVDCHWDRSLTLLTKGQFAEGFEEYEWRWKLDRSPPRGYPQPMWDGGAMKGKTILIHQEQGFGDMLQFARFLPMVKQRSGGATVMVEVQPELVRLFSEIEGVDKVIARGAPMPKFDAYLPMLSLARLFGTTLETVPAAVPYLRAPEMDTLKLPPSMDQQFKLGIAWAGRPTHKNDANRSAEFRHFVEFLGIPGVTVYSLQKCPREADIGEYGCQGLIANVAPRLGDFADTAAVVEQLDLVITVDTAIGHLAGALGKPAWVAVPFAPDWRWLLETETSPWYPKHRLFRQSEPGGWDDVFARLRKALREQVGIKPVQPVTI
jgi:tetratricopeptide (TPR) repeat protein